MTSKATIQTLFQTLKNEQGCIDQPLKHFKSFLRQEKDGNDSDEDLMGPFETRLQFVLDVDNGKPHKDLLKDYFANSDNLSLNDSVLYKELVAEAGKEQPGDVQDKMLAAQEDVKKQLLDCHQEFIEFLYEKKALKDVSGKTVFDGF